MKIVLTGRKMEITDDIRGHAEKKFSKFDRYFQNDAEAHVVCRPFRGRYIAEVTVNSVNMFFRAQSTASDLPSAFDEIVDLIERQIRKNKTRLGKRLRAGAFERDAASESAPSDNEELSYDIIRRKRFAIKPMAIEEAVLQMNLLEHQFFAFKNADDDNRYCVVYKRHDGGYGLIESD